MKSLVVLDWLDAIGGPALVEHVHCVYATELGAVTLSSLQSRIWKKLDALVRGVDTAEQNDSGKVITSD